MTELFDLVLKIIEVDNNKIVSSNSKTNKINKILIKFENIKKLLKAKIFKETRCFETTYLSKFQNYLYIFYKKLFKLIFSSYC